MAAEALHLCPESIQHSMGTSQFLNLVVLGYIPYTDDEVRRKTLIVRQLGGTESLAILGGFHYSQQEEPMPYDATSIFASESIQRSMGTLQR